MISPELQAPSPEREEGAGPFEVDTTSADMPVVAPAFRIADASDCD